MAAHRDGQTQGLDRQPAQDKCIPGRRSGKQHERRDGEKESARHDQQSREFHGQSFHAYKSPAYKSPAYKSSAYKSPANKSPANNSPVERASDYVEDLKGHDFSSAGSDPKSTGL